MCHVKEILTQLCSIECFSVFELNVLVLANNFQVANNLTLAEHSSANIGLHLFSGQKYNCKIMLMLLCVKCMYT